MRPTRLHAAALFVATIQLGGAPTASGAARASPPLPIDVKHSADASSGVAALAPPIEGMAPIAGGTFTQGSTTEEMRDAMALCRREPLGDLCKLAAFGIVSEGPPREVTLSGFFLDRTEVTVGAYRRCVRAGACAPPGYEPGDPRFDGDTLPVTHVSWDNAEAYCAYRHARLPTEAEWERAARGLSQRIFPWGMLPNGHLANHGALDVGASLDEAHITVRGIAADADGFAGLAPIASFPDGATSNGIYDLAGNVAEWVSDRYDGAYPFVATAPTGIKPPLVNPTGPTSGTLRVVRGGSYRQPLAFLRAAARDGRPPADRDPDVGLRCARDRSEP